MGKRRNIKNKLICQFNIDGKLIKTYDNVANTARKTNISRRQILYSTLYKDSHIMVGGYIWRYADDNRR